MPAPKSLNQINLVPKDEFDKGLFGKGVKWALTAGKTIVILTEFVVILAFLDRFKLDRDLNDLSEQISQKQYVVENFSDVEEQMRDLQLRLDRVEEIEEKSINISSEWEALKGKVPSSVTLQQLQISNEELSINAVAGSELGFYSLVNNFKSDDRYSEVNLSEVEFNQRKGGVIFSLKARKEEVDG